MSRLIVVSNRVAAGEDTRPSAGGLAVGVMDALKQTGGVWFGWNGEIVGTPDAAPAVRRDGNVTYATLASPGATTISTIAASRTRRCGRYSITEAISRASTGRSTRAICA